MKFRSLLIAAVLLVPVSSMADSVGGCGFGSKLMEGNKGIIPQILAVTTNGISGNQTFGISTGTLGCTQDGVVRSDWKMALFLEENRTHLAKDISEGRGETLESLASLMGVQTEDKELFFVTAKNNFGTIFPSANASHDEIIAGLNKTLSSDSRLQKYLLS